jgi:hypothetical protein
MQNLKKIRPVGGQLFYTYRRDGKRTDMTKLIAASRKFANAPKNEVCIRIERPLPERFLLLITGHYSLSKT